MADPIKFVQLDCHLDEKFEYIEAEFGIKGFAIIVKLFQRIYGGEGYYCKWNGRLATLFAHSICENSGFVRGVVSAALREGIFDEEMLKKYEILTSHGIQKRFAAIAKRRDVIFDKPEYVIPCAQISVDVCNSGCNVDNSTQNVDIQTTSKVKRSKAKQSKAKAEPRENDAPVSANEDRNYARTSAIDREFLVKRFGSDNVGIYERKFDKWKNDKATINVEKYDEIFKWMQQDNIPIKADSESSFDMDEVQRAIMERYRKNSGSG